QQRFTELGLDPRAIPTLPGVLQNNQGAEVSDALKAQVTSALEECLKKLQDNRLREGQAMATVLLGHLNAVKEAVANIMQRVPNVVDEYRDKLRPRLE